MKNQKKGQKQVSVKKQAEVKKERELVLWKDEPKSKQVIVSTSWNDKKVVLAGKVYSALKSAKDIASFRKVLAEQDMLRKLNADSAARKAGMCKNTHYESAKTGMKKLHAVSK